MNQSKAVSLARMAREEEQVKEREARGHDTEEKGIFLFKDLSLQKCLVEISL
jgi:hypothetical protein